MDCFDSLKSRLRRLGILYDFDANLKSKLIVIAKQCGLFIIDASYFFTPAWYFVFEARTPKEHSESLIFILSALLILSWYSALLFHRDQYASFIDELNSLIEKSK